ncbi:MAG: hypothetical protein GY946_12945 [bacterium]|nr:hypothetical protein [bacterium]
MTKIVGIGTALPRYRVTQSGLADRIAHLLGAGTQEARRARAVIRRAHVETRYSCIPDFGAGFAGVPFGAKNTTASERFRSTRELSPGLAAEAARKAIQSAGLAATDIDHLLAVSSTCLFSPGIDSAIIEAAGLRREVGRGVVGFMGCEGFFSALEMASRMSGSSFRNILIVCVELPTLQFRLDDTRGTRVANALFGDGAGALVLSADQRREGIGLGEGWARHEAALPESQWEIGTYGIEFGVSAESPDCMLVSSARRELDLRIPRGTPRTFALQASDARTISRLSTVLDADAASEECARTVLRETGNTISANMIFVLEKLRKAGSSPAAIVGLRPGLSAHIVPTRV